MLLKFNRAEIKAQILGNVEQEPVSFDVWEGLSFPPTMKCVKLVTHLVPNSKGRRRRRTSPKGKKVNETEIFISGKSLKSNLNKLPYCLSNQGFIFQSFPGPFDWVDNPMRTHYRNRFGANICEYISIQNTNP